MISLRYTMYSSPVDHPQKVMKKLGINYKKAIPHSVAEQWWFIDCSNLPEELPEYISILPQKVVDMWVK